MADEGKLSQLFVTFFGPTDDYARVSALWADVAYTVSQEARVAAYWVDVVATTTPETRVAAVYLLPFIEGEAPAGGNPYQGDGVQAFDNLQGSGVFKGSPPLRQRRRR